MTRARTRESGFVLVGVIMFVLALTILGISLFSISSFESQFLGQSHDENAALYSAQGGMDMVKELLARPPHLMSVSSSIEGIDSITYARAFQFGPGGYVDSTGPVDFGIDSVTIVVQASVRGQTRRVQAKFRPGTNQDYYKRLFTIATSITAEALHPDFLTASPPFVARTNLDGEVWQADSTSPGNADWVGVVNWPGHTAADIQRGAVPLPAVDAYLHAHPAATAPITIDTFSGLPHFTLTLGGIPDPVRWYVHPTDTSGYSPIPDESYVTVLGNSVWMFPHGFRADHWIHLDGAGTLVIVGAAQAAYGETGIDFHGGLTVAPTVNVILVSDGGVKLRHLNDYDHPGTVQNLSVYARWLGLLGPSDPTEIPPLTMDLAYPPSMDAVIDFMRSHDALPEASSTPFGSFAMIRGSWQDITP